jgi:hypothetical protein
VRARSRHHRPTRPRFLAAAALGEQLEDREHRLLGADWLESAVGRVAIIGKSLGIQDLRQSAPKV